MSVDQEIDTEKARVFQCPNCKEYINSRMAECRFCHAPIDAAAAQKAADLQDRENKLFRRQHYARHMGIGIIVFLVGAIPTAMMLYSAFASPTGGIFFVFYGAIIGGLFDFLYGLDGWLEERRTKE